MEFLMVAFSAFITAVITKMVDKAAERDRLKEIERSYIEPVRIPLEDKRNSILLVGLGGTGKTAFIRGLLQNKDANPDEKTESFDIYHGSRKTKKDGDDGPVQNNWFYIADYKGQNIGQLVRSFIVQQKTKYSPFAYGHINSLVLMVDLWPPNENNEDPDPMPQQSLDMDRVNLQNAEWNNTALDAIFGLLTNEITYVALFINKVDLMADRSADADKSYVAVYSDLCKRIKLRCGKAQFQVYLGSAKKGTNMNNIEERLMHYSVSN